MVKVGIEKLSLEYLFCVRFPKDIRFSLSCIMVCVTAKERVVSFSGKVGFELVSHMKP